MSEDVGNRNPTTYVPGMDRRHRKPDVWSRALRYLALLIYPILIINLFIFVAVAGQEQSRGMASQKGWVSAQSASSWVSLHAFLPVMVVGLLIGAVGLFLSRKRARRRYDYKFQNQLILILLSVVGLVVYLFIIGKTV